MIKALAKVVDSMRAAAGFNRPHDVSVRIIGHVKAVLTGPDGVVKQVEEIHNLATSNGDSYFASAIRVGGAAWVTNALKLGTATTTPTKTGAGSFIGTGDYVTGSAKACDSSSPKVGGSPNITQYLRTYAAGEATNATINRVAIVDNTTDAGEVDATHTLATALFDNTIPKGASDTLAVTWTVTFLGA